MISRVSYVSWVTNKRTQKEVCKARFDNVRAQRFCGTLNFRLLHFKHSITWNAIECTSNKFGCLLLAESTLEMPPTAPNELKCAPNGFE